MMKTTNLKSLLLLVTASVVMIFSGGCGKKQTLIYDQPELARSGFYEKAWVDPVIIFSDSLYTLIRSDRVDSFYVDQPTDPLEQVAPSVMFKVPQGGCFATANLLDDKSQIIHTLLARKLGPGYYKITCNTSRLNPELSPTGVFFVRVIYCGFQVVERLTVR